MTCLNVPFRSRSVSRPFSRTVSVRGLCDQHEQVYGWASIDGGEVLQWARARKAVRDDVMSNGSLDQKARVWHERSDSREAIVRGLT